MWRRCGPQVFSVRLRAGARGPVSHTAARWWWWPGCSGPDRKPVGEAWSQAVRAATGQASGCLHFSVEVQAWGRPPAPLGEVGSQACWSGSTQAQAGTQHPGQPSQVLARGGTLAAPCPHRGPLPSSPTAGSGACTERFPRCPSDTPKPWGRGQERVRGAPTSQDGLKGCSDR